MIYFIFSPQDPRSLVKIGYTGGPIEVRLKALQTSNPFRLCLIMAIEGDCDVESRLHRRFRNSKCHGEWFFPTEELRQFIRETLGGYLEEEMKDTLAQPEKMRQVSGILEWTPERVREEIGIALAG